MHQRSSASRRVGSLLAAVTLLGSVASLSTPAAAGHGDFPVSTGIYRIPYADGSSVTVYGDHHDHNPKNRIDMGEGVGSVIVAAASGWIRAIADQHGEDPNPGDGMGVNGGAQDDAFEHTCHDDTEVEGNCTDYNNYVWIEHPNGEWTKYTHFGTSTVSGDYGWSVGDWIEAGEPLGLENDIGYASGEHLHFEVGLPDDPTDPHPFCDLGGYMVGGDCDFGVNLAPLVCDIPDNLYATDETYDAAPCAHLPPTANAGGPYTVDEGTPLPLDGTGSSDPEGLPLTYAWDPSSNLDDPAVAQPTFTAPDDAVVPLTLTVYDQVEALHDSDDTTVTVENVAPELTIDPVATIQEGGTVEISAEFTDPGFLDTHTATIDWGAPLGSEGSEIDPPSIQILDAGDPGPLRGKVTGAYRYGDDSVPAGYTVTVTVTDDDGDAGSDTAQAVVENVDPTADIDLSGATLINGVPTILAHAGEPVDFSGTSSDPGSDDLTFDWNWDDGTTDSGTSLVDPPAPDPFPSPSVDPRVDVTDAQTHTFGDACVYGPTLDASDDDGGASPTDTAAVLITGNADEAETDAFWHHQYKERAGEKLPNPLKDLTAEELLCYLEIVRFASPTFPELRGPLDTLEDGHQGFHHQDGGMDEQEKLEKELLAAWLNFANGAYDLGTLVVDTDKDKSPDLSFADAIGMAETVRGNPASTTDELKDARKLLEDVNRFSQ